MRRKPAGDRKADIVGAVLLLADRIGPDRLTTNDVAREVGLTQAAIFRHFPTKTELWSSVGEALCERLTAAWAEAQRDAGDPATRLRALVEAQLRQIAACPALPAILHSRELSVGNSALRERCRDLLSRFQAHLTESFGAMAANGDLRPGVAPADAAVLVTSLIQGLAIRWTLGARNFDLVAEGLRMFDVQAELLKAGEKAP